MKPALVHSRHEGLAGDNQCGDPLHSRELGGSRRDCEVPLLFLHFVSILVAVRKVRCCYCLMKMIVISYYSFYHQKHNKDRH